MRTLHRDFEVHDIPVLAGISQIIGNDGPDFRLDPITLTLRDEVVAVRDQSHGSQRRTVALRASPVAVESGAVGCVLGLTQTGSIREQRPRGVADRLQNGLRMEVVLNVRLKGLVAEEELVDDGLEGQSGIARPCEEVCQMKH